MRRLACVIASALALAALAAATAPASGGLSGTFKTTIKNDTALHGAFNGTWKLRFENGTYKVSDNGSPITSGKYTIKGSTVSLKDNKGANSCPKTGKYTFKLKGKMLTFTKISDSRSSACIGRENVLAHKFTKVS
jgi:hypothetical protein